MFDAKFSSEAVAPSDIHKLRTNLDNSFKQFAQLIGAAVKPLPNQTGNGTDIKKEDPSVTAKINEAIGTMSNLGISDGATLMDVLMKGKTGAAWDDKNYLMEKLIQTAAKIPDTKFGNDITGGFLTQLYNDLQHPPLSYLGDDYVYRSADGSHNSLMHPDLGKAGTPYARTCAPKAMQAGARPDPGVIFDSVMIRKHRDKHPNGISSMLFYFASIIIHDIFRTNHSNFHISDTSSYLDLSPLYGSNQQEQNRMRAFISGKHQFKPESAGKIKPDCFSEVRLVNFPPGAGCLLIMFNRYHNSVVDNLIAINQENQFRRPSKNPPDEPFEELEFNLVKEADGDDNLTNNRAANKSWFKYDNDLFQTARLITCGLYINIVLTDYVRTILNLNKTDSNWALDPRADIKGTPVAAGNQCSAEFNLVYRWHSTISDRDEAWTEALWTKMFPNTKPDKIHWHDFVKEAKKQEEKDRSKSPEERNFADWERQADGTFKDEDLAREVAASIEDCANAYGANRVPAALRVIQILGIQQARAWNLASLNEFRKYFNLAPHTTFESINSDPYVADQLKHLYDTPDAVELYTGLVVEEPKKPMVPGAGLCPGYTVSRAVLSDAVALVRGDRFYTIDYHPRKLTNWGFTTVATDKSITNGCVFHKLILRALPNHFKANSIYAHYPLTIPSEMKKVMTTLNKLDQFDFSEPKGQQEPTIIFTYAAAKQIIDDQDTFKVTWGEAIEFLMGTPAKDFMLAGDGPKNAQSRQMMQKAIYVEGKWDKEVRAYYEMMTTKMLKQKSYKLAGKNQVDIIRDVGNLVNIHFASEMFSLPLKTEERQLGIFTEHEMYLILASVFVTIFFDLDPVESFPLRQKAHQATQMLGKLVEANVQEVKAGGLFNKLFAAIFPEDTPLKDYGVHMIKRLLANGMPVHDLVWGHMMGTAGGMSANLGQLFSQMLEYYLHAGKDHLKAMHELAVKGDEASFAQLQRYFLEGSRINGETGVFRYVTKPITIKDGPKTYNFKPGDKVMVNLRAASKDPSVFPDPMKVKLDRPIDSYIHLGHGPHMCLGWRMTNVALTAMLKIICKLPGLTAAPGPQGEIKKVLRPFTGDANNVPDEWKYHAYMSEMHDMFLPFPQSKFAFPVYP